MVKSKIATSEQRKEQRKYNKDYTRDIILLLITVRRYLTLK